MAGLSIELAATKLSIMQLRAGIETILPAMPLLVDDQSPILRIAEDTTVRLTSGARLLTGGRIAEQIFFFVRAESGEAYHRLQLTLPLSTPVEQIAQCLRRFIPSVFVGGLEGVDREIDKSSTMKLLRTALATPPADERAQEILAVASNAAPMRAFRQRWAGVPLGAQLI